VDSQPVVGRVAVSDGRLFSENRLYSI